MVVNWLADGWNTGGVATGQRINQVCANVCNNGWRLQLQWHWSVATSNLRARDATGRWENEGAALIVGSGGVHKAWSQGLHHLFAGCRFARLCSANLLWVSTRRDDGSGGDVRRQARAGASCTGSRRRQLEHGHR